MQNTKQTASLTEEERLRQDIKDFVGKGGYIPFEHEHLTEPQKPAEWSEEDKVMLNNIIWSVHMKSIIKPLDEMDDRSRYKKYEDFLKALPERFNLQPKQEWSEDNIKELTEFEAAMLHIGMSFFGGFAGLNPNNTNEVKEQAKLLLQLVPKQEWSEEDEINRQIAIGKFEGTEVALEWDIEQRVIKWLKSLRPQPNWKPSKEQMEALRIAYEIGTANESWSICVLKTLYNNLKKL